MIIPWRERVDDYLECSLRYRPVCQMVMEGFSETITRCHSTKFENNGEEEEEH